MICLGVLYHPVSILVGHTLLEIYPFFRFSTCQEYFFSHLREKDILENMISTMKKKFLLSFKIEK
jgi:hypothetical protein